MDLYGASVNLWIPLGAVAAHAGHGHTRWKGTTQKGRTSFSLFVRSCSIMTLPFHVSPFGEEMMTFFLTVQKIVFQHLTTYITSRCFTLKFRKSTLENQENSQHGISTNQSQLHLALLLSTEPNEGRQPLQPGKQKRSFMNSGSHRIVQGLFLKWTWIF